MTKRKVTIPAVVDRLLRERGRLSSGELADAAGVSRQAAHMWLKRLADSGTLVRRGAGRGSHYTRPSEGEVFRRRFRTDGLQEDAVFLTVAEALPETRANVRSILSYAVTEMVNNAIDHSRSPWVEVAAGTENESVIVEVRDWGIGALENVRRTRGLADHFEALQDLSKGKVTTMPARHSGEGIFFTSKAVDVFVLESNGLRWTVDTERGDQAVGRSQVATGTHVRLTLSRSSDRDLSGVFATFTDPEDLAFSTSVASVRLFDLGLRFISRSEAKRLAQGLEKFRRVELDFGGVEEVGQGFVDELFRVWAAAHPQVGLDPVRMAPAVEFMVRRGLQARSRSAATQPNQEH